MMQKHAVIKLQKKKNNITEKWFNGVIVVPNN